MRRALQAAPGNWAFVLQEVESDSGHSPIYQCLGQCGGQRRERGEKGLGLLDTLPHSLASRALGPLPVLPFQPQVAKNGSRLEHTV